MARFRDLRYGDGLRVPIDPLNVKSVEAGDPTSGANAIIRFHNGLPLRTDVDVKTVRTLLA